MPKDTYAGFMAQAYAMELEATERYAMFAAQLDAHKNRDVADLFRKLSEIEARHAKRILTEMGWPSVAALPVPYAWDESEGPETAPIGGLHPRMQARDALQLVLECELRAQQYFEGFATRKAPKKVRAAAAEMADEEREHVKLIREWLAR